ncbi:hypothetical protein GX563_00120 [Candidatus Bathyarchaeota archaeon]|nr:hypothetical protein [Candidatus Bathyarchaeota archaeon]
MSETKTNFIIAVRGYKVINKQRSGIATDIVAVDNSNNKVLLRTIEPLTPEYIGVNVIKSMAEEVERESYDSAIVISKHFTDNALSEINKQKIEYISEDYMPPFDIQELYLAIMNCANNSCQRKCGKVLPIIPECSEKTADGCRTKALALDAKEHFENGTLGLLKNDLRVALALAH